MRLRTRTMKTFTAILLGLVAFGASAAIAAAQSTSAASGPTAEQPAVPSATAVAGGSGPAEKPVKLEKFEVTGSFIPFASTQTALPLTVFDAQAIDDSGIATNLLDVLRKVAPQFSGSGNIGNANSGANLNFTAGGSSLQFRNVQTLVLVNGRRMAYAPGLAAGGLQFVDVNLIPLSAIERVEVLQDGASATYGTDAVAGVVNIILKTNYQGAEVSAREGISTNPGHYAESLYSLVGGTGRGATEITYSAELARSDALPQFQRDFASPSYGTASFAGVINTRVPNVVPQFYVLNPSLGAPPPGHTDLATLVAAGVYIPVDPNHLSAGQGAEQQYAFDLARYTKLLQRNERRSATLNLEHRVNDQLMFFGDVIYAATHTFSQLNAQPLSPSLSASNSSNPTTQTMVVRNRFVDYPRLFYYDSTSIRGIAGARGTFGSDFKWEGAMDRNVISQDYTNRNLVNSTQRAAAIAQGLLDLAAREQAPGAIEASGIFGTAWGKANSSLTTADARVSGDFATLPAGPAGFAVGTEYRVESLKQDADINSQAATFNWDSGVMIYPFEHTRHIYSGFAEVRMPLLGEKQDVPMVRSLEFSGAVRYEHYSDAGSTTVPKVGLAWHPGGDELLLRATYSKSFVAPTLYELFGPTSETDGDTAVFTQLGGGQVARDFHIRSGANPNLLPSHSVNKTAGFVWSPRAVKGFSLTVDYFNIEQTDLVGDIGSDTTIQDVELKGPASPYAQFVKMGAYNGAAITAPGQLSADTTGNAYVTDTLVNVANLKLRGVDVKAEYHRGTAAAGRFDTSLAVTSYQSYTFQALPSIAPEKSVGLVTDFNGTLPRWQSNVAAGWSLGRWRANLNWQHIPGVTDPLGDGTDRRPYETKDYDAIDVGVSCTIDLHQKWLRRLTLHAGVNNVFNRMPPYSGGSFPSTNADTGTYSPIGRLVYLEGKFEF